MLDEPVASLDPLARREFLQGLMEAVAERDLTVLLSTHVLADVERVCDHLVLLDDGRVRVAGDIDDLLAGHRLLAGGRRHPCRLPAGTDVVEAHHTERQSRLLVRTAAPIHDPWWEVDEVGLEELVLAYMSGAGTGDRLRAADALDRGGRPMTWLAWRQLRTGATITLAAVAAAVVLLLVTGPRLAAGYDAVGLADCAAGREAGVGTLTCGDLERQFLGSYAQLRFVGSVLVALPASSAPSGERRSSPASWRPGPTGWPGSRASPAPAGSRSSSPLAGVVAVAVVAALSLAFTWWSGPLDRLGSRIDPGAFPQRGVVPVVYAAFALALGVAAGAVLRRTVPAMAAAVAGYVLVRLGVQSWVRPRLAGAVELTYPTFTFAGDEPAGRVAADTGWVLATRTVDGAGRVLSRGGTIRDDVAVRLCDLPTTPPTKQQLDACGQQLGLHDVVKVVPADRFWVLQAWEAAVFAGLAVALGAFCYWWIRRRVTR